MPEPLKVLTLRRFPENEDGTFGVIFDESGKPILTTVELPWKNNQEDISCIPPGEYSPYRNPATDHIPYEHFVIPVQGRSGVAIHKGNTINDVKGCIAVGTGFSNLMG